MSQSFPNIDKIFSMFDGEPQTQEDADDALAKLAVYHLGMFQKYVHSSLTFPSSLGFLKSAFQSEKIKEDLDDWSTHMFMLRGFRYAEMVDPATPGLYDKVKEAPFYRKVKPALDCAIKYFEDLEIYEYCAILHKIRVLFEHK